MRDYLVIEGVVGGDLAERRAAEELVLATGAWTKVAERRWFSVFVEAARPPAYRHLPSVGGALIGEVFDVAAAKAGLGQDLELMGFGGGVEDVACRLVDRAFGRYVAILNDDRGPARVLRDPLGAMEAIGWRRDGLRFIASRLPDIPALWPAELAVDWQALGEILRQKNLAHALCPLVGVVSYPPGVLAGPTGRGAVLWSPARFVGRAPRARPEELRTLFDGVVRAWLQGRTGVICEISGGLDSAIVAATLAKAGAPLLYGLNDSYPQAEADERVYAQAVADRIGAPLIVVERTQLIVDPIKLVGGAGGPRPNYVGGDPDYDAAMATRLAEPGVDAVFTGRGGDAVLYQPPIPALAREVLRGRCDVARLRGLEILARRNKITVLSLLGRGLARQDLTAGGGVKAFLSPDVAARPVRLHPWMAEAKTLDPTRQIQIIGVVNNLSAFGESQRHRAGDVIDPWISQPIFEFCLAAPTGRLAIGEFDRPFARAAFADRLPDAILTRRGKGNLSTYFARSLGGSLELIRPYLLEGRLAKQGLLNVKTLEAALSPDQLIWTNLASEIFILLAIEAWARSWCERLDQLRAGPSYRAGI